MRVKIAELRTELKELRERGVEYKVKRRYRGCQTQIKTHRYRGEKKKHTCRSISKYMTNVYLNNAGILRN